MKRGFVYRVIRHDDNKLIAEYDTRELAIGRADQIIRTQNVATFVADGKGNVLYQTIATDRPKSTWWYRDDDTRG